MIVFWITLTVILTFFSIFMSFHIANSLRMQAFANHRIANSIEKMLQEKQKQKKS